MTNPPVGPRFRLAPGVVLRGGRRPPLPTTEPDQPSGGRQPDQQPGGRQSDQPRSETSVPDRPSGDPTSPPSGTADRFRNTRWDRAALAVSIDPVWLLAPLYARDAAGLVPTTDTQDPGGGPPGRIAPAITAPPPESNAPGRALPRRQAFDSAVEPLGSPINLAGASAAWPAWWSAALAYRPGTPAPRPEDLIGESTELRALWTRLEGRFRAWCQTRPRREPSLDAPARSVEHAALADFQARTGREPGPWTVRILEIPVTGRYLHSPEPRRIVVSAALRADPDRYRAALTAELPRHF